MTLTSAIIAVSVFTLIAASGHTGAVAQAAEGVLMLKPCPESPNCVSSLSSDPGHLIAPLRIEGEPDGAIARLAAIVKGMRRSTIVRQDRESLVVEFRTFLGFVDDAEFVLSRDEKVIHVRSAARTGYWDLGVNRKRIEEIRDRFGSLR